MTFKENLLKKIKINSLVEAIKLSLGPANSERRLDTPLMRELLSLSPLKRETARDLELYIVDPGETSQQVLVLDNELAIYNTTVQDVAMRKSPTIKEMVSIRNAIKILSDKNVIVSKKEGSLETIQRMCLETLNLSYTPADIHLIAQDGMSALAAVESEGVTECLVLFAELLGFLPPPKPFQPPPHQTAIAKVVHKPSGDVLCGPLAVYDSLMNTLKLMEHQINSRDGDEMEALRQVYQGVAPASLEGAPVIAYLEKMALKGLD